MARKIGRIILNVLVCIIFMAGVCLMVTTRWEINNIGQSRFDNILFSISNRLDGANLQPFYNLIIFNIIAAVVIVVVSVIVFRVSRKCTHDRLYRNIYTAVAGVIFCCGICYSGVKLGIFDYVKGHYIKTQLYEENYVAYEADKVEFPEDGNKKNLVYIYIESMERTYADRADGGAMDENLIPKLTELAMENEEFSVDDVINGAYVTTGTDWTAASQVAQTCGVPLKDYTKADSFLPGVTSIGDILKDNGYSLEYIGGCSASYGELEQYFAEHGSYSIRDYKYMKENSLIPEGYYVNWGVEDEKVFDLAKDEITRLQGEGEPFAVSIATMDTHFPDGYKCRLCGDTSDIQYENSIMCSDSQVYAFVEWLRKQDCYDDTVIVLCGDHLTMDQKYINQKGVPDKYERKVYTTIINSTCRYDIDHTRKYSLFDMYPTTLAAMGVKIEGDRLGLGVNLYSDVPTLVEEMGLDKLNSELEKKSVYYDEKLK